MDRPLTVAFHGFDASATLRPLIERKAAELERFHPHLVGCEVTVELPHRRKQHGNKWRVKIVAAVPGEDVRVTREADDKDRHEDPVATVNDAFAALKRMLGDRRHKEVGETKHHEAAPTARIHALGADHGFLSTLDGRQLYFHRNAVLDQAFDRLAVGAAVAFVEEDGVEGPQASTVRPL
jgi:ribosome-associated translation inhibitor RaiA/cold shock CspA family protein